MTITIEQILEAAQELENEKANEKRDARQNGRKQAELCPAKLHDMKVLGRQIWKKQPSGKIVKNGRYCLGCKRIRESK